MAYVTFETLEQLGPARETPQRAPEIAVEILSPGHSERNMTWKVAAYLDAGTRALFVVDPACSVVIAYAPPATGSEPAGITRFGPGEIVTHPAMPGFAYAVDTMFSGRYLQD